MINTESRYVAEYPYCGAFQPPPESGLGPTENGWATGVIVNPLVILRLYIEGELTRNRPVDDETVFECKVSDLMFHFCELPVGVER